MPSPISVSIPVTSWMYKYLAHQSEDAVAKILHFSRKHEYNVFLLRLVSNYRCRNKYSKIYDEKDDLNCVVKIALPFSDKKDVYFYNNLSRESMQKFRFEIRLDFLYDFKVFLRNEICRGKQKKIAIRLFFEKFGINEDDLKFESFERKYTRYLNKSKRLL